MHTFIGPSTNGLHKTAPYGKQQLGLDFRFSDNEVVLVLRFLRCVRLQMLRP